MRVTADIPMSCIPEPTDTASSFEYRGLRKTSPWTNFQPVSSAASSAVATSLYLVMSRYSVLSKIMATMPDKNTMMSREFKIENQWISPADIFRYTSHLEAQRWELSTHTTS